MCAIIDASVVNQVFGEKRTQAGSLFLKRIQQRRVRLAVGGKLTTELAKNENFKMWLDEARRNSQMLVEDISDDKVNDKAYYLEKNHFCKSDDEHIIALAQISGARLLYSEDKNLRKDFKKEDLINNPRGKVYSKPSHKHLLSQKDLCKSAD